MQLLGRVDLQTISATAQHENLDDCTQRCWLHSCRPIHAEIGMDAAGVEARGNLNLEIYLEFTKELPHVAVEIRVF